MEGGLGFRLGYLTRVASLAFGEVFSLSFAPAGCAALKLRAWASLPLIAYPGCAACMYE